VAVSYKAAPSSTSEGLRHVRDIHLVMAPHERGAVTFCVLVDGDLLATLMDSTSRNTATEPATVLARRCMASGNEYRVNPRRSSWLGSVMTPIPCVVHALAEVVVPDPPLRVCDVEGRPVPVGEGGPYPVVALERDQALDSHGPSGLADVLNLALEPELGRLDADDDEPEASNLTPVERRTQWRR
jgi:hypothetical protein